MKKKFLFTVIALAALAVSAYAQCKTSGGEVVYCEWDGKCNPINLTYAENPATATCPSEAKNCIDYSTPKTLYTGVTTTGGTCISGGGTAFSCNATCQAALSQGVVDETCPNAYCKWDSSCGPITTDKDGVNGSITSNCADAISNCAKNSPSKAAYSNATCTTPIPGASSSSAVASSSSRASSSSSAGASSSSRASSSSGGSSSSVSASSSSVGGSSSSVGGSSSSVGGSSSSEDEDTPIISYNSAPIAGLNVVHFARSLQIASGKDATVALFNMHGKQIFSQKVLSGTTTISLEKQKQGVYYAVVRSGSQKQTVKVVLK